MSNNQITRQDRADVNGNPVVVYYRDATIEMVYRYAGVPALGTDQVWLYAGDTDKPLARFDSVAALESAVGRHLTN